MSNPYLSLPAKAFWRSAVANVDPLEIGDLWSPKWSITPSTPIITAGSCFAQHIGRELFLASYRWLDCEPSPPRLRPEVRDQYNYGRFSFRTGNIYTVQLLRQWLEWVIAPERQSKEIWEREGRFFDPFRPNIEPGGFKSEIDLFATRRTTLGAMRRAFLDANVFIVTLGLTEYWVNAGDGAVYPICPGTVAGRFDSGRHEFRNSKCADLSEEWVSAAALMRLLNPNLRILLTVSPVPLTATTTKSHILVATARSKAALRAFANDLAEEQPLVDYFPSYEMITGAPFRSMFYRDNLREVGELGVAFVMRAFFNGLRADARPDRDADARPRNERAAEIALPNDPACEERLLDAFGTATR